MLRKSFSHVLNVHKKSGNRWSKTILARLNTKPEEIEDMQNSLGQQVWEDSLRKFQDLGFSLKQTTKMLLDNPLLPGYQTDKLCHSFDVLKSVGFKTEEIKEVLVQEPKIFDRDPRILKKNHLNLTKQLGDHQGRIAALAAPNTLIDNSLITNQKIDYCIMEMLINKPTIAKSKILKCPYILIKTRHKFAFRSGFYKKIDPKNKEGLANNPSIPDLFFSSDKIFLSQFKGFSLEDYVVFEEMMMSEEDSFNDEDEKADDKDDQTDEDSDDENVSKGKKNYSRRK
jgi:DNA-binding transcriptional MerR regulator